MARVPPLGYKDHTLRRAFEPEIKEPIRRAT
jgi:hypothetical protein